MKKGKKVNFEVVYLLCKLIKECHVGKCNKKAKFFDKSNVTKCDGFVEKN